MHINKFKIVKSNNEKQIVVNLDSALDNLGYQTELDDYVNENIINEINDVETIMFEYGTGMISLTPIISFNFYNSTTNSYNTRFTSAGFNYKDVSIKSNNVANSFFIMEVYDSTNQYKMNKITTNFLSKLSSYQHERLIISDSILGEIKVPQAKYVLSSKNQFYSLNIPKNIINKNEKDGILNLYARFSFYNAKNGKLTRFLKSTNSNETENQFIGIKLDTKNLIWWFDLETSNVNLYELKSGGLYSNKINRPITNRIEKKQQYPPETGFDILTGKYD